MWILGASDNVPRNEWWNCMVNLLSKSEGLLWWPMRFLAHNSSFFGFTMMRILEYIDWSIIYYCRTGSFSLLPKWQVQTWYNLFWLNWCYCSQIWVLWRSYQGEWKLPVDGSCTLWLFWNNEFLKHKWVVHAEWFLNKHKCEHHVWFQTYM